MKTKWNREFFSSHSTLICAIITERLWYLGECSNSFSFHRQPGSHTQAFNNYLQTGVFKTSELFRVGTLRIQWFRGILTNHRLTRYNSALAFSITNDISWMRNIINSTVQLTNLTLNGNCQKPFLTNIQVSITDVTKQTDTDTHKNNILTLVLADLRST